MIDSNVKTVICQVVACRARQDGLVKLAKDTGATRLTLAQMAAGLPVREGSFHRVANALGIHIGAPAAAAISSLPTAGDLG